MTNEDLISMKTYGLNKVISNLKDHLGIDLDETGLLSNAPTYELKVVILKGMREVISRAVHSKYVDQKIDALRAYQVNMLQKLFTYPANKATENLIPFYFEPAKIILYYDIEKGEVVIFFQDKYTGIRKDIASTIVKVSCQSIPPTYGFVPAYMYEIKQGDKPRLEINEEHATRFSIFEPMLGETSGELMKNYDTELFPCELDGRYPKYLTKGRLDGKLGLDLVTVIYCYLGDMFFDEGEKRHLFRLS